MIQTLTFKGREKFDKSIIFQNSWPSVTASSISLNLLGVGHPQPEPDAPHRLNRDTLKVLWRYTVTLKNWPPNWVKYSLNNFKQRKNISITQQILKRDGWTKFEGKKRRKTDCDMSTVQLRYIRTKYTTRNSRQPNTRMYIRTYAYEYTHIRVYSIYAYAWLVCKS